jgi:type II secretory ATPase GspE/PulE/Tfp pilus assembly ATPase PilB-like protein
LEVIQAEKLHQSGGRSREDEQAVIKFVHSILYKAVDMAASDIMFQEYPHRLRVRYKLAIGSTKTETFQDTFPSRSYPGSK